MFVSDGQGRILSAARGLVRRRGYAGVSLRRIAAAARYSPAGLYAHFPGLEGILDTLADAVREELGEALADAAASAADPKAQLAAVGQAYIAFAAAHPAEFELLFRHTRSRKRGPADPTPSSFDLVRDVARQAAPDVPADVLDRACLGLWATVHGLATLRITHLAQTNIDWEAWSSDILRAQVETLACGY